MDDTDHALDPRFSAELVATALKDTSVVIQFALAQSLHQIQLAQGVEAGIGIVFAVGSERRIFQHNPRGVGWPDFLEQFAFIAG